ncbi:site-2 protease family protein [Anaeromyxobacter sp. SG26]|uniref:site-2 protease family protein n=1 Tax=Anaeromyxobacter sp. SG26 TaxID=2925407 RepID=UPI001F588770|nr:site-2 protease family protein [Anaeromyxobacter sp. SG26]
MDDVLVRPRPRARFPAANVALFLATLATTGWAGLLFSPAAADVRTLGELLARVREAPGVLLEGLPFALSLVGILFTHEMGHYVLARRARVDTTLPYFIPVPFGVGTLGAVIRMRSPIPSRRALLDIGASGPLGGLVVALPLLVWGLAHSEIREVSAATSPASPFGAFLSWLAGRPSPEGAGEVIHFGHSLLTLAAQRLVVGPLAPGTDVVMHPVAVAASLGLLVTALNLVPAGQLDGGHVLYALFGRRRAHALARLTSAALLLAGIFASWSWLLWWFLTRFVVGLGHPAALVEEPLGPGRRAIAIFSLILFFATFVPVPVAF